MRRAFNRRCCPFWFWLQVTVFSAFLAMDANRQKAGMMDFCCCSTNHKHLEVKKGSVYVAIRTSRLVPLRR